MQFANVQMWSRNQLSNNLKYMTFEVYDCHVLVDLEKLGSPSALNASTPKKGPTHRSLTLCRRRSTPHLK